MSDATTADLLTKVLERLDRIEARLDAVQGTTDAIAPAASKTPVLVEAAAMSAQFAWDAAEARGIDPIESGLAALEIAAIAGQVKSIERIQRLLSHQDLLDRTLDVVEQLRDDGSLDTLIDQGATVAPKLAKLMAAPGFKTLIDHTLQDTAAIDTASAATTALVETREQGFTPLGLFGQLRALGDGDVQKAIGFTLELAKRFGRKL